MIDRRGMIAMALAAGALPGLARSADTLAWPPPGGVRLWRDRPPGAAATLPRPDLKETGEPGHRELQLRGVATPMLYAFRPARPNGAALLVLPGGGYEFLAVSNEGVQVAERLRARGYTVFVLSYRLPAEGWHDRADVPLQDAQRALRLIRAGAAQDGIDPARIGVIGFSAGGHLAASLATAYEERVYRASDAADQLSARPDFAGLIYAVTSLRPPYFHQGSRDNLLGASPAPALVDRRSPVLHVDQRTPPTFLLHALDDTVVPPRCSLAWLDACEAHHVPAEAHLIEHGGHGFGVGLPPANADRDWPDVFDRWIASRST